MKIFGTGFTGSLGTHLTKRLLEMGHTVVVYSRDEYKQAHMARQFKGKDVVFEVGDIRDRERTIEAVLINRPDIVIHAAAMKHVPVGEEEPVMYSPSWEFSWMLFPSIHGLELAARLMALPLVCSKVL